MVLVTKDQWDIVQKITEEQKEAMAKVVRDLNRYERNRRAAARIIGAQKKELCTLAKHNEYLLDQVSRYGAEISDLNEEIESLNARLSEEQETVYTQNDEIERLKGRVAFVGWAFEKLIKYK